MQSFIRQIIVLIFIFLCCCSQKPIKSDIKNQVKSQFLNTSSHISQNAPLDNWWLEFNDPALNVLINLGLQNNKDIAIANLTIALSRDLNNVQVSALLPSASIYAGKQKFAAPVSATNSMQYNIFESGFDAVWELDLFGKNLDRSRAGKFRFLEEAQLYKALNITVASEIARNYLELKVMAKQIANYEKIVAAKNEIIAILSRKERIGAIQKTEIYNGKIALNNVLSELSDLKTSQKILTYKLAVLLGKTPDQIISILKDSDVGQEINYQSGVVPVGLKSDILKRRPDILAAEYEIEAAILDKNAQLKEFFPNFNLTANIGGGARNLGDVFKDGANLKNIQTLVSIPVFQGGRLIAEYKISKNKAKIAVLNYENIVLKALEETESALLRYVNALQIEDNYQRQLKDSFQIVKINQNKRKFGAISNEDLLNSQIANLEINNQFMSKKLQTLINLIAVHKAIGGGFEGDIKIHL